MQSESAVRNSGTRTRTLNILLYLLLLAAGAEFIVRGPLRFLQAPGTWNDLSQNYVGSRLWLTGKNPCDPNNFVQLWRSEGRSHLDVSDIRTHLAPPLGTLVLLAPIAALPWPVAKITWLVILLLAFVLAICFLFRAAGFRIHEPRGILFLGAALALAPFHTGFSSGNSSVLVIAVCVIAIGAAGVGRDVSAGILLGIASSLKPQIGALFVLYYLLRQRWRIFFIASGLTVALALLAALSLQLHTPGWSHDYIDHAKGFVTADKIDDFRADNPIRFTLINLQVPLYAFTGAASTSNILALSLGGILLCVWMYFVLRSAKKNTDWLGLSAIAVLGLLPVYHRFYDAAVLILPLYWSLTCVGGKLRRDAIVALILMTSFLFPGAAWLQSLVLQGRISEAIVHSWYWDRLVMPHEVWTLLLLSLVLLFAMAVRQRDHARPFDASS
jgi:hypothetical protein